MNIYGTLNYENIILEFFNNSRSKISSSTKILSAKYCTSTIILVEVQYFQKYFWKYWTSTKTFVEVQYFELRITYKSPIWYFQILSPKYGTSTKILSPRSPIFMKKF